MQAHHWLMLIAVLVVGYFIGANYKMNLPVVG